MKPRTFHRFVTFTLLFLLTQALTAQTMLVVQHEGLPHVVHSATPNAFTIQTPEGAVTLPRTGAQVYLRPHTSFLPGFIQIDEESAVEWDSNERGDSRNDQFYFRYSAQLTSNRDLPSPVLVFEWIRGEHSALIEIVPLDPLKAGEKQQLSLNFWVQDRYRLVKPNVYLLHLGYSIGTSKDISPVLSPYAYALQKAENGALPDGHIQPISFPPLPVLEDEEGNARKGSCKLRVDIDALGYVQDFTVVEYSEPIFAKAASMNIPFCLFKPRIKEGEPVPTAVRIPFQF